MESIKTVTIKDKVYQILASVDDKGNIISETYLPIGNYIEEAPTDENTYGRKNGEWIKLVNIYPISQEEYDRLPLHNENTLYIIYDAQ